MSLVSLPYMIKFLWAPVIDQFQIPFLSKFLGKRRAWLFLSQTVLMLTLFALGHISLEDNLLLVGSLAFFTAWAASTQDMTALVYQVERLPTHLYGAGEAVSIFGYRMGILAGGAGSLYLAEFFSWNTIYKIMSCIMVSGVLTTLFCKEPLPLQAPHAFEVSKINFLGRIYKLLYDAIADLKKNPGWLAIILVMAFYKVGDNLVFNMKNIFYLELGFSKIQIANATKIFGMASSIAGGLLGGVLIAKRGVISCLFSFGIIHCFALLGYLVLSSAGNNLTALYATTAIEEVTRGMCLIALFSYQMMLYKPVHATTQLAFLTTLYQFGRIVAAAPAGWVIETGGWNTLFLMAFLLNGLALLLVKRLPVADYKTA
jgi:PAT family beta-lactamase induction signal transducer AmpG